MDVHNQSEQVASNERIGQNGQNAPINVGLIVFLSILGSILTVIVLVIVPEYLIANMFFIIVEQYMLDIWLIKLVYVVIAIVNVLTHFGFAKGKHWVFKWQTCFRLFSLGFIIFFYSDGLNSLNSFFVSFLGLCVLCTHIYTNINAIIKALSEGFDTNRFSNQVIQQWQQMAQGQGPPPPPPYQP